MAPHGKPGEEYVSSRHRMVIYIPDLYTREKTHEEVLKAMLLSRLYFILPSERELLGIRIKS